MKPIKVYEREIADGIGELVKANASVAYLIEAKPLDVLDEKIKDKICKVIAAANPKQADLFYLDTILASVGWNKNKDIFTKSQMWEARHTAEDKPFNLNHVQNDIIGHITSNYAVTADYKLIPDNSSIDDVPDQFHILTSAVLYKFWEEEDRAKTIAAILDEIQEGGIWYVSMECLFSDFDYGLVAPDGEQRVIARTEESSFLTKYLAQYGGKGQYEGYSIGRVLKNITFCGKGLVKNPANPDSKILTDVVEFNSTYANLGYIKSSVLQTQSGESDMNEAELKAALAKVEKENADLKVQLSDTSSKAYTDKITDLTSKLEAVNKDLENEKKAKDDKAKEAKASLDGLTEAKTLVEGEVEKLQAAVKAATDELDNLKKEKKVKEREAKATEAGADVAAASEFASKYSKFSDEDYTELLALASYKWKGTAKPAVTADQVIASVTAPKPELVTASETEGETDKANAEIAEYIKAFLNPVKEEK